MAGILAYLIFLCVTYCEFPKTYWIAGDSEAGATAAALKSQLPEGSKTILTYEVSSRIEKWAGWKMKASKPNEKVDVVIVFLGTNHYSDSKLPPVTGVLDVVRLTGAKCIWVGPPKVNNRPWKLNNDLRAAVEPTCTYVDSQQIPIELRDGIHPTSKGAQTWSQKIVEALK